MDIKLCGFMKIIQTGFYDCRHLLPLQLQLSSQLEAETTCLAPVAAACGQLSRRNMQGLAERVEQGFAHCDDAAPQAARALG